MGHLTVVLTTHIVAGRCNEEELLRILRTIGPGVIFEELSSANFHRAYVENSIHTLEVRAVRRLIEETSIPHLPVDEIFPPAGFKERMDLLLDYVESDSLEYASAVAEQRWQSAHQGFGYFSTVEFSTLSALAQQAIAVSVAQANSDALREVLATWNDLMHRREEAMAAAVASALRAFPERHAVLLVGAEHGRAISACLARLSEATPGEFSWSIWCETQLIGASIEVHRESRA